LRKHRKWWMGFGLGIALGASLLQLMLAAQDLRNAAEAPKMYTQAELDEAVENAVRDALERAGAAETKAGVRTPGESGASGQVTSGVPGGAALPEAEPSPPAAQAPEETAEKVVSFYIYPGMNLTNVARSLEYLGIVEDAQDFMEAARPIAKNIQTGVSVFVGQPTYDEIIAELTRKKEPKRDEEQ